MAKEIFIGGPKETQSLVLDAYKSSKAAKGKKLKIDIDNIDTVRDKGENFLKSNRAKNMLAEKEKYESLVGKKSSDIDPYDNTRSSDRSSRSDVLALTNGAYANTMLEKIAANSNATEFHKSMLQYQEKSVALLTSISDAVVALAGKLVTKNNGPAANDDRDLDFKYNISNMAKAMAGNDFGQASLEMSKMYMNKVDSMGLMSLVKSMVDTVKGQLEDGGIGRMVKDTIRQSIVKLLPSSMQRNVKEWKDDPGMFMQNMLNSLSLSNNAGIKTLFSSFAKYSELNFDPIKQKTDWKQAQAFDKKSHHAITEVIPNYLAQILSALTGKEAMMFDYDQDERYHKVSTLANRENQKIARYNPDSAHKENTTAVIEGLADTLGDFDKVLTRKLYELDEKGDIKRDSTGKVKMKSNYERVMHEVVKKLHMKFGGGRANLILTKDINAVDLAMRIGVELTDLDVAVEVINAWMKAVKLRMQLNPESVDELTSDLGENLQDLMSDRDKNPGYNKYMEMYSTDVKKLYNELVDKYDVIAKNGNPEELARVLKDIFKPTKESLDTNDAMFINATNVFINGTTVHHGGSGVFGKKSSPSVGWDLKELMKQYGGSKSPNDIKKTIQNLANMDANADTLKMNTVAQAKYYKAQDAAEKLMRGEVNLDKDKSSSKFMTDKLKSVENYMRNAGASAEDMSYVKERANIINNHGDLSLKANLDKYNKAKEEADIYGLRLERAIGLYKVLETSETTAHHMSAKYPNMSVDGWHSRGYVKSAFDLMKYVNDKGEIDYEAMNRTVALNGLKPDFMQSESNKYRKESATMSFTKGGTINASAEIIGAIYNDPKMKGKLKLATGAMGGAIVGKLLKDRGLISNPAAGMLVGTALSGLNFFGIGQKHAEAMFGPLANEKVDGANMTNRELATAKLMTRVLPTVAGGTVGAKAGYKLIAGLTGSKALGMVGGLIGGTVGLAAGKASKDLLDKMLNPSDENKNGVLAKVGKFLTGFKMFRNLKHLGGRGNDYMQYITAVRGTILRIRQDVASLPPNDRTRKAAEKKIASLEGFIEQIYAFDKNEEMPEDQKKAKFEDIQKKIEKIIGDEKMIADLKAEYQDNIERRDLMSGASIDDLQYTTEVNMQTGKSRLDKELEDRANYSARYYANKGKDAKTIDETNMKNFASVAKDKALADYEASLGDKNDSYYTNKLKAYDDYNKNIASQIKSAKKAGKTFSEVEYLSGLNGNYIGKFTKDINTTKLEDLKKNILGDLKDLDQATIDKINSATSNVEIVDLLRNDAGIKTAVQAKIKSDFEGLKTDRKRRQYAAMLYTGESDLMQRHELEEKLNEIQNDRKNIEKKWSTDGGITDDHRQEYEASIKAITDKNSQYVLDEFERKYAKDSSGKEIEYGAVEKDNILETIRANYVTDSLLVRARNFTLLDTEHEKFGSKPSDYVIDDKFNIDKSTIMKDKFAQDLVEALNNINVTSVKSSAVARLINEMDAIWEKAESGKHINTATDPDVINDALTAAADLLKTRFAEKYNQSDLSKINGETYDNALNISMLNQLISEYNQAENGSKYKNYVGSAIVGEFYKAFGDNPDALAEYSEWINAVQGPQRVARFALDAIQGITGIKPEELRTYLSGDPKYRDALNKLIFAKEGAEEKSGLSQVRSHLAGLVGRITGGSEEDILESQDTLNNTTHIMDVVRRIMESKSVLHPTSKDSNNNWIVNENANESEREVFRTKMTNLFQNLQHEVEKGENAEYLKDLRAEFGERFAPKTISREEMISRANARVEAQMKAQMNSSGTGVFDNVGKFFNTKIPAIKGFMSMSDLKGTIAGHNASSVGCALAACNNALFKLGYSPMSEDTLTKIAESHWDGNGVEVGFFIDVAHKLQIKPRLYEGGDNRFGAKFFNKLGLGPRKVAILLLHDEKNRGHYVSVMGISNGDMRIIDPENDNKEQIVSISDIQARTSLVFVFDDSSTANDPKESSRTKKRGGLLGILDRIVDKGKALAANMPHTKFMKNILMSTVEMSSGTGTGLAGSASGSSPSSSSTASELSGIKDTLGAILETNIANTQIQAGLATDTSKDAVNAVRAISVDKLYQKSLGRVIKLFSRPEVRESMEEKEATEEAIKNLGDKLKKDGNTNNGQTVNVTNYGKQGSDSKWSLSNLWNNRGSIGKKILGGVGGVVAGLLGAGGLYGAYKGLGMAKDHAVDGAKDLFGMREEKEAEWSEDGTHVTKNAVYNDASRGLMTTKGAIFLAQDAGALATRLGNWGVKASKHSKGIFKLGRGLARASQAAGGIITKGSSMVASGADNLLKVIFGLPAKLLKIFSGGGKLARLLNKLGVGKLMPGILSKFGAFLKKIGSPLAKALGKGAAEGGKKSLFKSIPLLGPLVLAGQGAMAFYTGWNKAATILGVKEEDLDVSDKATIACCKVIYEVGPDILLSLLATLVPGFGSVISISGMALVAIIRKFFKFEDMLGFFGVRQRIWDRINADKKEGDKLEKDVEKEEKADEKAENSDLNISSQGTGEALEIAKSDKPSTDTISDPPKTGSIKDSYNVFRSSYNDFLSSRNSGDSSSSSNLDFGFKETPNMLDGIAGQIKPTISASGTQGAYLQAMYKAMQDAGMSNTEQAVFMANVDNETGGLTLMSENLKYNAKRLVELGFSGAKNFMNKHGGFGALEQFIKQHGAAGVAEIIYGTYRNKNKNGMNDLGNTEFGDGWKYRGRGLIQLTGRNLYDKIGKLIGVDLVKNPDLVASDPEIAAKSAVAYWKSHPGIQKALKAGDYLKVRKYANGGHIGMDAVKNLYTAYLNGKGRLQNFSGDGGKVKTETGGGFESSDVKMKTSSGSSSNMNSFMDQGESYSAPTRASARESNPNNQLASATKISSTMAGILSGEEGDRGSARANVTALNKGSTQRISTADNKINVTTSIPSVAKMSEGNMAGEVVTKAESTAIAKETLVTQKVNTEELKKISQSIDTTLKQLADRRANNVTNTNNADIIAAIAKLTDVIVKSQASSNELAANIGKAIVDALKDNLAKTISDAAKVARLS